MSAPKSKADRRTLRMFQLSLVIPVVLCAVIGVVFLAGGDTGGWTLLAVGLAMGGVNMVILRVVSRKMLSPDTQDQS